MPKFNVRLAVLDDAETIVNLLLMLQEESPLAGLPVDIEALRKHVVTAVTQNCETYFLVAEEVETNFVVGLLCFTITEDSFLMPGARISREDAFYILPEYRYKNGIAHDLFRLFETNADEVGCDLISVTLLNNSSEPALDRLYRRKGYKRSETAYFKRITE